MRANRYEWQQIGRRFACDRNTAARRWNKAMEKIADYLCISATNQLAKTNQVG
jgi:hypothetical protein